MPGSSSPTSSASSSPQLSHDPKSGFNPHALANSIDTLPPREARQSAAAAVTGPEQSGNNKMLSAEAGAARAHQQAPGQHGQQSKRVQMKEALDLADGPRLGVPSAEIAARLEQKRVLHEVQRERQKRAFEQQMRLLQARQEEEERALLQEAGVHSHSTPPSPPTAHQARSKSGVDLFGFGQNAAASVGGREILDNSTKSLPPTRRHSGEGGRDEALASINTASGVSSATAKPQEIAHLGAQGQPVRGTSGAEAPLLNAFLFDDEIDAELQSSTYGGKYLQMNTDDDKFPILVRRDSFPNMLSASSAALDLAPLSQTPPRAAFRAPSTAKTSEWPQFSEPRHANTIDNSGVRPVSSDSSGHGANEQHNNSRTAGGPTQGMVSERSSPRPTRRLAGGMPPGPSSPVTRVCPQRGRTTSPVVERSALGHLGDDKRALGAHTPGGVGRDGKPAFSTMSTSSSFDTMADQFSNQFSLDGSPSSRFSTYTGLSSNGAGNFPYEPYGSPVMSAKPSGLYGTPRSPRREMETNRFAGLRLEDLQGDMYALCKDQFGCRYLQKKLEEGNSEYRDMIFTEIFPHFGELMTDSFGNYLSQKLFEYATDEQRDALLESISGELVSIALNMHGTRAVQKIIDHLSTQRQVQSLIAALNLNVVTLIRDLNGNHVIQKCLNHLPPEDNQFIYNAVAANCIEVATHRHGCCVLQRCIDHATESQRIQLITEITYNSLTLVQDPFGNYTVQYCLDLADPRFTEAIIRQFLGNICALSAQKFSSNVVEKCIRVADPAGRRAIVDEILAENRVERLLRDSFGNYVCQTALDYSEPSQRTALIQQIRPILPQIRNTPYGKRIQSKIARDHPDHHPARHSFHPALMAAGQFMLPGLPGSMHHAPHHFSSHHPSNSLDSFPAARAYLGGAGGLGHQSSGAGGAIPFAPMGAGFVPGLDYGSQSGPGFHQFM